MNESVQQAFQASISQSALAIGLGLHLPGVEDSWNALLQGLKPLNLLAGLRFLRDLQRELATVPPVSKSLLSSEVVAVALRVVMEVMRVLRSGLVEVRDLEACAAVLEYCASKRCPLLAAYDLRTSLEDLLRSLIGSGTVTHSLLTVCYSYSCACEKLGLDYSSVARLLRQLESQIEESPVDSLCEGLTSHLVLLHCLSLDPVHRKFVCQKASQMLSAAKELTQLNCLLLLLRMKWTEGVGEAQVCQDFWKFARELSECVSCWPKWASVSEFQLFWIALRRSSPSELFFLAPLLDFLTHDVVRHLRVDGLQFILKTALRSAEARQQAAQIGLIERRMVSLDMIERLFQAAVYPKELQLVIQRMRSGQATEVAAMLVRIAEHRAERKEFECRYSGVPWNLSAAVLAPSLLDAIFTLGGPEVFLYVFDWPHEQGLRLQLLRLMKLCLSQAPSHFLALLSLKLEESSELEPLNEEEILELLGLTGRSSSHKKHILLNPRLWRALPHAHYLHYIYPAIISTINHREEFLLKLYEELWERRADPDLWKKVGETLDILFSRAVSGYAAEALNRLMACVLANKQQEEKVRPLFETVLRILGEPTLDEPSLGVAWGLVVGFSQRLEGAPPAVVSWAIRVLELAQRRLPRLATLVRCVDLAKAVVYELTTEVYQALLHCFAGIPDDLPLSADILLRGKLQGLSCLLELLPRTPHSHAAAIWRDFDGALQQPALLADLPGFLPALAEAAAHFLVQDIKTPVYLCVARCLSWRVPLSDNLPALKTFVKIFLTAERRRVWSHFGDIVEHIIRSWQKEPVSLLPCLLNLLLDASLTHCVLLELGFLIILRSLEEFLRSSTFYALEDNPKRPLLQMLFQAIRDTEVEAELRVFLKALDTVLTTSKSEDGWGEVWSLAELGTLECMQPKQTAICEFVSLTLSRKLMELPDLLSCRKIAERLVGCEVSEVTALLQQEAPQLQALLKTLRPAVRPRIWAVPDPSAGRARSVWKGMIPVQIQPARDQNERLQLMLLRCQWKATKKRLEGLCGPWSVQPTKVTWKVANFMNKEGLRTRLVPKRGDSTGQRISRSFVQPPTLRLSSSGIQSSSFEEPKSAGDVENPDEWEEQSILCERIWPLGSVPGQLEVTDHWVCFASRSGSLLLPEDAISALVSARQEHTRVEVKIERAWRWSEVQEVWQRRFLHRHTAIEIFLKDGRSYFFNCFTEAVRGKVQSAIQKFVPMLRLAPSRTPKGPLLKVLNEWRQGRLSNLAYLMKLNHLAGRSYNDLSQYPVFPWVLSDFQSSTLNLNSRESLRDLSIPVGAQTETGRAEVYAHYELMRSSGMVPFHFGSHYSTCGLVSYYLIRLEPFTSVAIDLQDGKYDVADRLFSSVADAWQGCLHNAGDFKELLPEFFGLPEAFINVNNCKFGRTQEGIEVSGVELPVWSRCGENFLKSAYHFISLHLRVLESVQITEGLPRWIDLVFGCKQKGAPAIEALNVFFPYTYEEEFCKEYAKAAAGDRQSMVQQVAYYGQTPVQVLLSSHPNCTREVDVQNWDSENVVLTYSAAYSKTVLLAALRDTVVCVADNRMLRTAEGTLASLESDPSAARTPLRSQHFAVCGRVLISCFYSECSFKTHSLETGKLLQLLQYHIFPVTCLACEESLLLAGSEDCTLSLWTFNGERLKEKPDAQLRGHHHPILRCAVDVTNDLAASVDSAGEVLLHSLGSQRVLAVVRTQPSAQVVLALSRLRLLAVYNRACEHVDLFTHTGSKLDTLALQSGDLVEVLLFSKAGHLLYTGGSKTVSCFDVFSQRLGGHVIKVVDKTVRAMSFIEREAALLVALQSNVVLRFETSLSKRNAMVQDLKRDGFW